MLSTVCGQFPLWRDSCRGTCERCCMHRWWLTTPIQCWHTVSQHPLGTSEAKAIALPFCSKQAPNPCFLGSPLMVMGSTPVGCCKPWRWMSSAFGIWCLCFHPSRKLGFSLVIPLIPKWCCERHGMYGCIKFIMPKNDCSSFISVRRHLCDSSTFSRSDLMPSLLKIVP